MFKFSKYIPLIIATILASSLASCDRQKANDDYIAMGMPPELVNNGIMVKAIPGPNMPEQSDNNPGCP